MNLTSLQKNTLVEALELMNEALEQATLLQSERQNYQNRDIEKIQALEDKLADM